MYYEVVPEGKVEKLIYDYIDSLLPGQIVMVPIGQKEVPGIVIKKVAQPNFRTKSILKVLYSKPLPQHLMKTVEFLHEYYLAPSGQAVSLILPRGIQKNRRKTEQMFGLLPSVSPDITLSLSSMGPDGVSNVVPPIHTKIEHSSSSEIPLNPTQKNALQGLQQAPGGTKLLYGITGSGKTNIYLKMALNAFKRQKSSIILVPEIALTGQLVRIFQEVFKQSVLLLHSKQTEAERHLIFSFLLGSSEPKVIIGPRSALFAPVANLGLIIIDEEHENTYYQENPPRYSAIRIASLMAKELKIPLILGSATPTVEDFYLAERHNSLVKLEKKAIEGAKKPKVKIIDFKNRDNFGKNRYFSTALLNSIQINLENSRQTLIFHNRRGSSPLTICEKCGEEILCPNCFLPLTLHADKFILQCHTCGFSERVPTSCPKCGHPEILHKGFGTKLLESELKKLFPKARVARFDADSKKNESVEAIYEEIKTGGIDILVGTQTITKGLDLPKLATVGVVQADAGLSLPDFAAEERTFQLLTQVIGRVGRGHLADTNVFIQTFRPEHPILKFATKEDYLGFYKYTINQRRKSGFPPFQFIVRLELTLKTEALVLKKIQEVVKRFATDKRFKVSPPQPAFHERTNRGYTWRIIVRSRSREAIIEACKNLDKNFKIVLDPPSLL